MNSHDIDVYCMYADEDFQLDCFNAAILRAEQEEDLVKESKWAIQRFYHTIRAKSFREDAKYHWDMHITLSQRTDNFFPGKMVVTYHGSIQVS